MQRAARRAGHLGSTLWPFYSGVLLPRRRGLLLPLGHLLPLTFCHALTLGFRARHCGGVFAECVAWWGMSVLAQGFPWAEEPPLQPLHAVLGLPSHCRCLLSGAGCLLS